MDVSSIIGIIAATVLLVWAMLLGGPLSTYWDQPSAIMVFGGATGAFITCFPLGSVLNAWQVAKRFFLVPAGNCMALISDMVRYAEIARRDGILALENVTQQVRDPFVKSAIQMAVDGTDPALIEQILNSELDAMADRHADGKAVFDCLGKYAPAYGMIGTLVGLVVMLKNMSDPSTIGAGMAVALLTTLYGAVIANVFCLPMADKVAARSREELFYRSLVIKGIMAIQAGDNPRVVEQKLWSVLTPKERAKMRTASGASKAA
jgi:chemotaxis protein MotA